ncbi:hypothetical protein [Rossellomorea sp. RS05]|uniref:hypothetical protein n=1 Tax=Rossellomorea sp. RS05 TaxID=3149166 RepID=UPI003221A80B
MIATERQALREQLLVELYDYHFANKGEPKNVLREVKEDDERFLAYKYLDDKGLIRFQVEIAGMERRIYEAYVSIQSYGIDTVENNRTK